MPDRAKVQGRLGAHTTRGFGGEVIKVGISDNHQLLMQSLVKSAIRGRMSLIPNRHGVVFCGDF